MDNDLEKTESERVDIFHDFVKAKLDDGSLGKAAKDVLNEAERLEITNKAPIVLCELLFDEGMVSQVNLYCTLHMLNVSRRFTCFSYRSGSTKTCFFVSRTRTRRLRST